jgi:hypothetical protein
MWGHTIYNTSRALDRSQLRRQRANTHLTTDKIKLMKKLQPCMAFILMDAKAKQLFKEK